ncbi:hypothetical protein ACFFRR_001137 [Megaselia abdita]
MSNENSKLLSTLASNVDSINTSQNSSNYLKNKSEVIDIKELDDSETELKEDSETELKDLLEEAYSYKTPGDKKNKSKKFLQLLEEVESETEDNGKFPQSLTRYGTTSSQYHHNQSHGGQQKYGGSLQDLVDAKRIDAFFEIDCSHSSKSRRNCLGLGGIPISRTRKNSSVSTRQREGGSLPSNVNNTNLDLRKDQLKHNLLHEVTRTTNTITTTTTTKECLHNSDTNTPTTGSIGPLTSIGTSIVTSIADTVIDMEVDALDEDHTYLTNYATTKSKPQRKLLMGTNDTGKLECVELIDQKHYVDDKVIFTSLDRSSNIDNLNRGLSLDETYKSYTSVLEKRSSCARTTTIVSTTSSLSNVMTEGITASANINVSSLGTVSLKHYDENGNLNMSSNSSPNGIIGNACNTSNISQSQAKAKNAKRQKEKNVRVFKAGDIPCNCGDQDINTLVSFINNDNSNNENKNKKLKKKDKEKELKSNVLKKSSSLEELRSCAKLTSDDSYHVVTLRNKGIKTKPSKPNSNNNIVRKGERRSWGTEELPYYEELTSEDIKTKKKSSDPKIQKKEIYCTEIRSKGHSMESINSEPSDFLLVTKKKKPKKRQTMDDSNFSNHNYTGRGGVFIKKNGQGSELQSYRKGYNLVNEKEYYYNTQSVNHAMPLGIHNQKSRRKSTSSMPPSDKSDISDSDSVHSLPIENKKSQNSTIKQKNQKNQPQSYAEITKRKKSQGNITTVTTTTNTNFEVGVHITKDESCNNKFKPKTKHKTIIDFPELVPTSISTTSIMTPQPISYSQSLVSPAFINNEPTSPTLSNARSTVDYEFIQPKQVLYKSKSMDNDNNSCTNAKNNNSQSSISLLYNSIDQYPALEKTIKRHVIQQHQHQAILSYLKNDGITNDPKPSSNEKFCVIEANKKLCQQITSKKNRKPCSSSFNKNLNRPAVIILFDDPNQLETIKLNQFTFGDFKEDELKFLSNSEEQTFNLNSTFKSTQDVNISLESDNGYSSSLNQSTKTVECAFMHDEDAVATDSQNNIRQHKEENNKMFFSKKNLRKKNTSKIITCSEIEDSLTSQISSSSAGINFNFENTEDEDEYVEDEKNATTSSNNIDEENDAIVNENNIESDTQTVRKASCTLSFKPPKNTLLPTHNERIIDFIGTGILFHFNLLKF